MTRPRVLVTSATSDASLSAIRSLAKSGHDVLSADVRAMPFGAKSWYAVSHHVLDNASPDIYAESLMRLVRQLRPDALLPLGTRAVIASSRMRYELDQVTSLTLADSGAIANANDKFASIESCASLGIPCVRIYSEPEARELAGTADGNVCLVVKPRANVGAARGVRYVRNENELARALENCTRQYGEALIQDYVPGGPEAMKTLIVLFSDDCRLFAAFTTRKQRQWPSTGGLTVVSHSTSEFSLVSQMLPLFEAWRWTGPAEIELKHDSRTGTDKVIEINPRFPAYLRFAQRCGLDLVTSTVRLALETADLPQSYPAYSVGMTYVNPGLLLKSAISAIRGSGASEIPRAIAQLRAGFPFVTDMLADPVPFLGRALEDISRRPPSSE